MKRIFPTPISRAAVVTALSAAIAFSPMSAQPARAGDEQLGAIAAASFFAMITAGIIASAAKSKDGVVIGNRRGPHDRTPPRVDRRKLIPAQCEFTVRGGPDRGTYYASRCLKRNFDHWAFLPDRCEEKVWVPRQGANVNAYDAQCLARFGYREAGSGGPRAARR